jgi:hypothetical protein
LTAVGVAGGMAPRAGLDREKSRLRAP